MLTRRRWFTAALPSGAFTIPEFLSAEEHDALASVVESRLGRRRYERDHWDSVITNYRETELAARFLGGAALEAVEKVRSRLTADFGLSLIHI